ncbi:DNA integrity scanning diadenylate cyclase DisA [Candidatus Acetothermia bacterium]|jgi:diadenylate cyclase|nr:DNA integrity scanning diadenylate cyclase DisA [Candidatus Acetothermia bacterium]MCI2432293.1 DNA integrity scanning diadenylate cyclase DisA [Candidatus Acetothermia bacterium]MCI2437418.1 DNA integrity scanning diadenylate cyclase DisA [Candidatus Acetothermia bacterium]
MPKAIYDEEFLQVLAKIAPGTLLRDAINSIVQMRNGGLIVLADTEKAQEVVQAGFWLDADFTPQRVVELSKMDRAIVLSEDLKKISYANAYLVPDPRIPSDETGTRHLTAEKVAKQLNVAVIAISAERFGRVTVYYGPIRYVLQDSAALSARVNQALRILEQYRVTYNELSLELTALELEGRVLPYHVANILQNIVQMIDTEEQIRLWFIELGEERDLMQLLLEWLMLDVREQAELLVRDFQENRKSPQTILDEIRRLPPDELLSTEKIMEVLGYAGGEEILDQFLSTRGYRVLSQIPRLPPTVIDDLVGEFGSLRAILRATEKDLMEVKGIAEVRARAIRVGLRRLKNSFVR